MGYSPNVVSKHDIIYINGVRFRAKYDFNLAHGDKNLLLQIMPEEPKTFIAYNESVVKKEEV